MRICPQFPYSSNLHVILFPTPAQTMLQNALLSHIIFFNGIPPSMNNPLVSTSARGLQVSVPTLWSQALPLGAGSCREHLTGRGRMMPRVSPRPAPTSCSVTHGLWAKHEVQLQAEAAGLGAARNGTIKREMSPDAFNNSQI